MLDITSPIKEDHAKEIFEWQGESYNIDFSYDNVLRWFNLLRDPNIDNVSRMVLSFAMFVGDGLEVPVERQVQEVNRITDLISASPYEYETGGTRHYDYQQDSEAIYASFMQDYGIDLIKAKGRLSYFKFRALFDNLSDKSPIGQIMHIRAENPAEHSDNPKYLQEIVKQQAVYALHKTDEEKEQEIAQAFADL